MPVQVCFASIRPQAKCGLNGGFRLGQSGRSVMVAGEVNYIVSIRELAIRQKLPRVLRDSLIQQVDCLEQSRLCVANSFFPREVSRGCKD